MRAMLDAVAQNVDHAALADLALQAGEELATSRAVGVERQRFDERFLGSQEKAAQLHQVDAVLAVVVVRIAENPASAASYWSSGLGRNVFGRKHVRTPGHGANDEFFEAFLARVGPHTSTSSRGASSRQSTSAPARRAGSRFEESWLVSHHRGDLLPLGVHRACLSQRPQSDACGTHEEG